MPTVKKNMIEKKKKEKDQHLQGQVPSNHNSIYWAFVLTLGIMTPRFGFGEALQFIRCLACYNFLFEFLWNPFQSMKQLHNLKTAFLRHHRSMSPHTSFFYVFSWDLINSMRAQCPLDDITRRKHFTLKGSEYLFNCKFEISIYLPICLSVCLSISGNTHALSAHMLMLHAIMHTHMP